MGPRKGSSSPGQRRSIGIDLHSLGWFVVSTFIALGLGVSIAKDPTLPATAIPAILMLMILALLVHLLYRHRDATTRLRIMKWVMGAFFFHFFIGEIIWQSSTLTSYFGGDAITYNDGGIALAHHWAGLGPMPALPPGKDGFFYLLGILYTVFGEHAGAGIAFDAGFAAAFMPLLHDATERQFGESAARYVLPICMFMPGFMIWSSQMLRESGVYFGIALSLNAAVRISKNISFGAICGMISGVLLVFVWRASIGVLMGGGFLIAFILQRKVKNTFATVIIAGIAAVLVMGLGIGHSGLTFIANTNLQQINNVRMGSSTSAASGFLPNSDISTGSHAIGYLPIGTTFFMFGPAPWQIQGVRQLLAAPDALVWWALLPSLWRGIKAARRRVGRAINLYLLPAFANAIGLSLIIANFGTAVRERMQVIVFLVPLIALGLSLRKHPEETGSDADNPIIEADLNKPTATGRSRDKPKLGGAGFVNS